ncbi:MAG: helix-turn-helix transcriptional regulator [Candidatus Omnitrophica bacterium]|nr:helix-turn-helix transcriptional regulator [Candidatus Omnitrophota bacterium]
MKEDIKVKFAKHLKKLREERGLTQQQLAELSNLEYKHIQRMESKKPCDVKLSTLEKLAKAFCLTLENFFSKIDL